VRAKDQEIEQGKAMVTKLNIEHLAETEAAQKEQEKLKKGWEEAIEDLTKQFYEKELEITHKYEDSVRKIEDSREYERHLYRHNIEEIRSCIEKRPSKVEDV
jgi:hypothetical protein